MPSTSIIQASANRTLEESQNDKAAMSSARSEMDDAYHGFVDSVNLHVKYDGVGELSPFIKYLNTELVLGKDFLLGIESLRRVKSPAKKGNFNILKNKWEKCAKSSKFFIIFARVF